MGFKYKVSNDSIYFLTITVVDWIDVFTRKELAEIVIESLKYCQKEKGLVFNAKPFAFNINIWGEIPRL